MEYLVHDGSSCDFRPYDLNYYIIYRKTRRRSHTAHLDWHQHIGWWSLARRARRGSLGCWRVAVKAVWKQAMSRHVYRFNPFSHDWCKTHKSHWKPKIVIEWTYPSQISMKTELGDDTDDSLTTATYFKKWFFNFFSSWFAIISTKHRQTSTCQVSDCPPFHHSGWDTQVTQSDTSPTGDWQMDDLIDTLGKRISQNAALCVTTLFLCQYQHCANLFWTHQFVLTLCRWHDRIWRRTPWQIIVFVSPLKSLKSL